MVPGIVAKNLAEVSIVQGVPSAMDSNLVHLFRGAIKKYYRFQRSDGRFTKFAFHTRRAPI
mgnify:CR=1 FL=1